MGKKVIIESNIVTHGGEAVTGPSRYDILIEKVSKIMIVWEENSYSDHPPEKEK